MDFIRKSAARIVLLLFVLGLVLGSFAAWPVLEAMRWMIGTKYLALMGTAYALLVLALFFPVWWAWWCARRAGLEDRWYFVAIVWGIAVGGVDACLATFLIPAMVFDVFFVPQLREMHLMSDTADWLAFVLEYWMVAVPILYGIAAVYATRFLARRWHALRLAWRTAT